MTINELYEFAKKNNYLKYDVYINDGEDGVPSDLCEIEINDTDETIIINNKFY